jgi:hypothetical protein
MYQEFLEKHLEKHAGPIEFRWEELLFVRANEKHNCHVVMTCGMSDSPMNAPKDEWQRLELCALLPAEWPLEPENWDEERIWPLRGLQMLSRLPFETDSWLGLGHTFPTATRRSRFRLSARCVVGGCCRRWNLRPPFRGRFCPMAPRSTC